MRTRLKAVSEQVLSKSPGNYHDKDRTQFSGFVNEHSSLLKIIPNVGV